jgi:hypothetical protein
MKCSVLLGLVFFIASTIFAAEKQATAILLDNSRSISNDDFQKAKSIINEMHLQLPGSTMIYVFGNDMKKVEPANVPELKATESYTMIYDAAYDAAQELSSIDAERKAIVIISDGQDTKSATVLEDVVRRANADGIVIYGVGVSNANRKVLERMARLTGGKYFTVDSQEITREVQALMASRKPLEKEQGAKTPAVQQPSPGVPVVSPPAVSVPVEESAPVAGFPYKWILLLLIAAAVMFAVIFVVARSYRSDKRVCPTCGRTLEPFQTICPSCSVPDTVQTKRAATIPSNGREDTGAFQEEGSAIPMELLEKKPVTEEMLSKTFVLMETPMLVVRKGKNLGQTFSLNRSFPVSIGRSRVNEIRLDDITISGQHCRIIPENGKHVLYDLNSTNGTFLNEKKVTRSVLKEGDNIRVGETQFLYKIEQHRA